MFGFERESPFQLPDRFAVDSTIDADPTGANLRLEENASRPVSQAPSPNRKQGGEGRLSLAWSGRVPLLSRFRGGGGGSRGQFQILGGFF